jgi:signal transduction histidine kinase/ActR/RegA family two-component response regulator
VTTLAARSQAFAQAVSLIVTLAALLVLAGWLLHAPGLTALYLSGPTLKTNAAICLASVGLANLLFVATEGRWRWLARVLALLAATIGALTLSQHLGGWDLGIDQLIATEAAGALATSSPNRMGPPASMAHALLGIALLLLDRRDRRAHSAGHLLALVACAIALLPVTGYAYGFPELYSMARLTGIAMITAVALLLLGLAVQAGRPESGLPSLLCREDEIGVLYRWLVGAGILLPFGMGWVLARLYGMRIIDPQTAISTMALVLIVVITTLVWRTGTRLAQASDARAASERALSESERSLREADLQKSEFLATLSHELRNPLAPIRFAVELLGQPAPIADRAKQTIARQVQHLTRLIDDLLDLTRISRNKLELHVRPCELRPLVQDAVDAVAGETTRARHRLDVALPSERVWLLADPDRVVQMIVNLLTNAARHSPKGSRIAIEATVDTGAVAIAIRDEGEGLDPADLDRVFDRFVQVGENRHGGLGIGLAIVKALAELHGGEAEARSAGRGRGAEFRIRLPRAVGAPADAAPPAAPAIGPRRILVVDDNRDAADMLGSLLTAEGHEVAVAYDGADALSLAPDLRPEVGLVDIGMAGMNGYELAGRLRGEAALADMFLVAITGWGQDDDRRRALASGFDAHLTKPAEPSALAELLAHRFPQTSGTAVTARHA